MQKPQHELVFPDDIFHCGGDHDDDDGDHDGGNKASNERGSDSGVGNDTILQHSKSSIPNGYHNPNASDMTNPNMDHTKDHTMTKHNLHSRKDNKSMGSRR